MADDKQYKASKTTANLAEIAFFRLFTPLTVLVPFMGEYSYFFFLTVTFIDTWRCALYFLNEERQKKDQKISYTLPLFGDVGKVTINRWFYGLKCLLNILASIAMITANVLIQEYAHNPLNTPSFLGLGMETWLFVGQLMFMGGVVALSAVRYLAKVVTDELEHKDTLHKSAYRPVKNLSITILLVGVTIGLSLLFFQPNLTLHGGLNIGALTLLVANMVPILIDTFLPLVLPKAQNNIPVVLAADKANANATPSALPNVAASAFLVAGLGVLLDNPKAHWFYEKNTNSFNASTGLELMIIGFAISTLYAFYNERKQIKPGVSLLFSWMPSLPTIDLAKPKIGSSAYQQVQTIK